MDNANYAPPMLQEIVCSGVLRDDPFVLIDVGCGLGIDDAWRLFEPYLHVHAFDPQVEEIRRMTEAERNPDVHYHAGFVGLPDGHPFREKRAAESSRDAYFTPWSRLSTARAMDNAAASGPTDLEETNDWSRRELSPGRIVLSEFLAEQQVESVDFVKSDTDGDDLEVLYGLEDAFERTRVLGLMVETPYTGSDAESTHTFHNVDRLLRRHGFQLATLSVNRYSRAALPAPFVHQILAQTTWGQAIWGDVIYVRDGVHPDSERFLVLSRTKLLKLACICELFLMPDVAAEILVERRELLQPLVDVDQLLDLLTPPLDGRQLSYAEYVAAFEADPTSFYPDRFSDSAPAPAVTTKSFTERARGRIARSLRS